DEAIRHHLSRPMVGNLAAPVGAHHRNGAAVEYVFGLAGLAQGIDGFVLDQPDFIRRVGAPAFGVVLHGLPHLGIGRRAGQPFNGDHYSTIETIGWPCKARYKSSSCSREVARTVNVRPM